MTSAGHALTIEPGEDGTARVACEWPDGPNARTFEGRWTWKQGAAVLELPVTLTLKRRRPFFLPDLFEDARWVHLIVLEARREASPSPREAGGGRAQR